MKNPHIKTRKINSRVRVSHAQREIDRQASLFSYVDLESRMPKTHTTKPILSEQCERLSMVEHNPFDRVFNIAMGFYKHLASARLKDGKSDKLPRFIFLQGAGRI